MNSQEYDQIRCAQIQSYCDQGICHNPKEALHKMLNDMLEDLPDIWDFANFELQLSVVQAKVVATREIGLRVRSDGTPIWHLESNINFGDESES